MAKPQVTLTLAGDASSLSRTFDQVGQASKQLADEVGSASRQVGEETASGFDKAGEAADGTYDKFDALESVGRGTTDTMSGLSEIMQGNVLQGATDLAGGVAALADGFKGALLPAIKSVIQGGIANTAATIRQTAVTTAQRGAALAAAAATNVMAVAQRILNAAMRANPIGLIITALILLGTGLVIAYRKSETFRNIVNGAFNAVKNVAIAAFNWIRGNWPLLLAIITGPVGLAVLVIAKHRDKILGFFRSVPGAIAGFFKNVGSSITAPFRAAFDGIRAAWNSTIGGKGFSFPGIAGHGAFSFRVPYFHTGGIVSGAMGTDTLAVLRAGEQVTAGSNSSGPGTLVFRSDGSRIGNLLLQVWKEAVYVEGGNPQIVLRPA